jgi:Prophage minor tail protein Z (GPZ)
MKMDMIVPSVELDRLMKKYASAIEQSSKYAKNDAGRIAMTAANKSLRESYNIKLRDVNQYASIRLKEANDDKDAVVISIKAKDPKKLRVPAYAFDPIPSQPSPKNPPAIGASWQVLKSRPRTLGDHYQYFVARMKNGHIGIFERVAGKVMRNGKKQAIKEIFGPSIPQMYKSSPLKHGRKSPEDVARQTFKDNIGRILKAKLIQFKSRV